MKSHFRHSPRSQVPDRRRSKGWLVNGLTTKDLSNPEFLIVGFALLEDSLQDDTALVASRHPRCRREVLMLTNEVPRLGEFDNLSDEITVGAAGMFGGDGKLCGA